MINYVAMGAIAGERENAERNLQDALYWHDQAQELQKKLAIAEAQKAGLLGQALAYRDALKTLCPNHPLFQASGQAFRRGDRVGQPKTNASLVYERAFDTAAARLRLASPVSQFRED